MGEERYTLGECCEMVGKGAGYVINLQRQLGLYVPSRRGAAGYSEAYVHFLQKVVALRTFSVPLGLIRELFEKERKVLELLHVDTLSDSPTWYLDPCRRLPCAETRLLLTGHDLGFPITADVVQAHLNFREKDQELFSGDEMGEDVRHVLRLYLECLLRVRTIVARESRVLHDALAWENSVVWPEDGE